MQGRTNQQGRTDNLGQGKTNQQGRTENLGQGKTNHRVGQKIMPKVGQVNRFFEEKGEQRRNFQARFLNLPKSAVAELEIKCLNLD